MAGIGEHVDEGRRPYMGYSRVGSRWSVHHCTQKACRFLTIVGLDVTDPDGCTGDTHGRFFSFRQTSDSGPNRSHEPKKSEMDAEHIQPNLTMNDAGIYTLLHTPQNFQRMYSSNYSNGFENDVKILQENAKDHRKVRRMSMWHAFVMAILILDTYSGPTLSKFSEYNKPPFSQLGPSEDLFAFCRLPNAPSMKQYCLYGYGKPTERSYFYMQGQFEHDEVTTQGDDAQVSGHGLTRIRFLDTDHDWTAQCTPDELQRMVNGSAITCRKPLDMPMARRNWIDTEVNIEGSVPEVRRGVKFGMGDGTVPLISLGAMCVKGWKDDRWNPARMPIITHEFNHEPEGLDLRGGAKSGKLRNTWKMTLTRNADPQVRFAYFSGSYR
jgi:phospholipid:diacylglycerol acyltransferase